MPRKDPIDLVYICDWLPPDFGAVGQYAHRSTAEDAEAGRRVVLVGLSSDDDSVADEAIGEGHRRTVRLHTRTYDKTRTSSRLLWTAWTNLRLLRAAWPYLRRAKEVVFTGSPPLFLHLIAPANLVLRRQLTYRITDFHPECTIAETGRAGPGLKAMLALTHFWRRRVHRFEVLGHDQAERLREMGIGADRVTLKRDPSPVEVGPETRALPRPAGSEGKVLLLYSGNWGVAHDETTFLEAYRRHHKEGSGRVLLWLNAVGKRAQTVREALHRDGLPFIDGRPVPLERLASLLVTPDAHLITLRDPFVGYVLPSKTYGCVASGRPILFIGSARSDVDHICREAGVARYLRVEVGDTEGLLVALEDLADTVTAEKMGKEPAQVR